MVSTLIAAIVALGVLLVLPGILATLRAWARSLQRSRAVTVREALPEAFVFVDARRFAIALVVVVLAVIVVVAGLTRAPLLASACGGLALLLPAALVRWLRQRRRRRLLQQLPDAVELLAASLRSGLGLLPAIAHLAQHQPAPLGQELALLVRRQRLGSTLEEALEDFHRRLGGRESALLVTAVTVARQLGGNLSEVLSRLARTLRERQAIEGKIAALTAQGRLQARIVGVLPVLLLLVMMRMDPAPMRLLYTTRQGWATLLVLGVLELSGALLLRRLVRIDV